MAAFLRGTTGRRLTYLTAGTLAVGTGYYVLSPSKKNIFPPPPPGGRPPPPWTPPSRSEMIESLKASTTITRLKSQADLAGLDEEFDLLVIGGGATGSGVAVDAASRGLKVALVERDDFSSGTSSKSTKLVHGGVRYLQKAVLELDYEQYALVREALHERKIFLQTAPYLSHMLPIMLPLYKWWQLPYYWAGCKMYDVIAGGENMEGSYIMTRGRAMEAFPMLKADGLVGALVYYDGQHNDSRMNVSLIMTAVQHGATVANYAEVTGLHKNAETGKLTGARIKDRLTGEEFNVRAKGVVNATGPFSDVILRMDAETPASGGVTDASKQAAKYKEIVAPSSGVHITLPNYYSPRTMGLLDPATSDGRVIFFLPWQGNTIAGTTDRSEDVTKDLRDPVAREEEIQWILEEIKRYLSPDIKVRRGDVLSAWSGHRPLIRDPSSPNSKDLVRNHLIYVSDSGLVSVAGGKWTTYRAMAKEGVDECVKQFGFKVGPCVTETVRLVGSEGWSKNMFIGLVQRYGLETEVAKYLADNYGDRAWAVAGMAEPSGKRWPLHGNRLNPNYPYTEAEVLYATRVEYAQKATDVLARRTRLSFLNASAALDALPRVIDIMAGELGWDEKRKQQEWVDGRKFLVSMGLPAVGKLEGDSDYGKSAVSSWGNVVMDRISAKFGSAAPTTASSTATTTVGDGPTRAHFSLEELSALKEAYGHKVGGSVNDGTKGVTAGELLQLVRDDLAYASAATGTGEVLDALRSVGVDVTDKDSRVFTFDEVVDVAATFKEAAGEKIMRDSASRMRAPNAIPVEKSGGGV